MTNVLPPKEREAMLALARARALIIGGVIMILAALFSIASLIPGFIVVRISSAELSRDAAHSAMGEPSSATQQDREAAAQAARLIQSLQPFASSTPARADAVIAALAARPAGVSVTALVYTQGEKGSLSLSGVATSRDGIQAYRTALSKDSRFASVSVPVSALLGASAGQFTITVTGAF